MLTRTPWPVLAMLLLGSGVAYGQPQDGAPQPGRDDDHAIRQIIPFLEGSYLFWSNEKHVIVGAAIFPHLMFWQNFDSLIDARRPKHANDTSARWRQYWAVSLTPGVRLKMSDAFSDPVRTPSYLPRVDIQKMMAFGRDNAVRSLAAGQATTLSLLETHFAVEHYSNGQDGCLFVDQHVEGADPAAAKCVPDYRDRPAPGVVNRHDGNFSTNEWRIGLNVRRTVVSALGEGRRHYGAGIEYQRQFATAADLKPFYSQNRVNATASIAWVGPRPCSSRIEAVFQAVMAIDHPVPGVSRTARSVQISCFPSTKGGFGAFVKGYWGQDPYNLGFLENIARFEVGLTFNQDGIFRFRAPR